MPWHRAYDIFLSCTHPEEGFYSTLTTRLGKRIAVLVKRSPITSKKKLFTLYRANIGLQPRQEQLQDIQRKYTKVCLNVETSQMRICYGNIYQVDVAHESSADVLKE